MRSFVRNHHARAGEGRRTLNLPEDLALSGPNMIGTAEAPSAQPRGAAPIPRLPSKGEGAEGLLPFRAGGVR